MKTGFKIIISILIVVLIAVLVSAGIGIEYHGVSLTIGGPGPAESNGIRILAKQNFTLENVTAPAGVTALVAKVFNDSYTLLQSSNLVGTNANFSINLTASNYYRIQLENATGSWFGACITNPSALPGGTGIIGNALDWVNGSTNQVVGNTSSAYFCNVESITYSNSKLSITESTYNFSTYETSRENFVTNLTIQNPSTARLIYGNTITTGSITSLGGNNYRFSAALDLPLNQSLTNWYWNITQTNGTVVSTNSLSQLSSAVTWSICGSAPQNINYLNVTFNNETTSQQRVNASITTSTFMYWLGLGTVNRTYTYSNANENKEYDFCFSPQNRSVNVDLTLSYDNSESEQRNYNPETEIYSNSSTQTTLFLLPTSEGLYVTFQVLNSAQQPIDGAIVTLSRTDFGTISTTTTGASGTTTVFLNPNFQYTLTVEAEGYPSFTATQAFPTSEFTITLGTNAGVGSDLTKGISLNILPKIQVLTNQTTYNFNMTINSTFWSLEEWGYEVRNSSGFQLGYNTSTASTGGFLSSDINTGNNTLLTMEYFWTINGTDSNYTISWAVRDVESGSISGFFDRLATYMNQGIFGIDAFGVAVILFVGIFLITGILSYSFGLRSPLAIFGISGGLVILTEFLGFFSSLNVPQGALSTVIVIMFIGIYLSGRNF